MAVSKCPKCDSTRFETKINAPTGSNFKVQFIQCASCGSVVGVTNYHNTAKLLERIGNKLGITNLFG